jgi:adenine-specific DNA-methyltransferase
VKHDATMQKLTAADPETHSPDLVAENLAALQALFPELITEGPDGVAVNVDVLKALVGDKTVSDADEKYGLNWHGKRRARQLALTPSTGTLRPCPEDSVDWDTTQNLMIEGDNLEVLKLLQKSYAGKVKLIYIDPPYNTGRDFVYPDNFRDNITNYLKLTGQAEGGTAISTNTEASGRFHTDWLNMMYPRLRLAKNLLRPDGAILVSIGDNEVHHLRSMLDELLGEENFVATVIWEKADSPRNTARQFSEDHDFILVYSARPEWAPAKLPRTEEANSIYSNPDNDPLGDWIPGDPFANKPYSKGRYAVVGPTGRQFEPPPGRYWRVSEEKLRDLDADGRIWWGPTKDARPSIKRYLAEVADLTPRTLWRKEDVGSNRTSKNELRSLFPESESFDTPKPIGLVRRMLQLGTNMNSEELVLDFFAGSGTTAHSVIAANVEDGGNRRFILVQLPEPIENADTQASTIAELTAERIRRATSKIKEDNPLFSGDLGFRVLKLASSNIRAWDPNRDKIAETLEASIEHLKTDRTEQDILFELLLKLGLDLCVPIETKKVEGSAKQDHDLHSIGGGSLLVCLSQSIPQADVEPLALILVAWHQELKPAGDTTVVFRDSAFADDVAKTNITAILQQHGLETVRSL